MNKRFLLWDNPRQAIFTLMAVLLLLGGINVFSASLYDNGPSYLFRYYFCALVGLAGIYFVRRIGYKRLLNKRFLCICYCIVLVMLVVVHFWGAANKGATRWIYIGSFSIQPSEIAKLVLIMLSARFLGNAMKLGEKISLYKGECLLVTMAAGIAAFGVLVQPDLGTAAIIAALVMGMFIIAGLPARWITAIVGAGVVGAVLLSISSEYRLQRLHVWFDPWLDPQGRGYQMVQSLLAIGSGGLTGTNWGHGAAKFAYLPEAHTDFAFAVFCQENGFFGALILLLVFCLLGVAFYKITISTRDQKGFLLAAGVTFLIIGQAFANMAMVCGIFPVIGVPLIFISYGGSSMIISMAAIGLLLSVYDEEEKQQLLDAEPPEKRRSDLRVVGSRRWQK